MLKALNYSDRPSCEPMTIRKTPAVTSNSPSATFVTSFNAFLKLAGDCDNKTRIKVAFLLEYRHNPLLIQSLVPHGE